MFPELNNLLSTTPDKTEQVRCRAARKGACPGSVREDCIRKAAPWGWRGCRKPRASGSCSLERARQSRRWLLGPPLRLATESSCVFLASLYAVSSPWDRVLRATLAPRGGCRAGSRGAYYLSLPPLWNIQVAWNIASTLSSSSRF